MTRIDFYVLQAQRSQQDRWAFACRLVEKALKQGNRVLLATDNERESQQLDKLLWSFKPESFVPHAILNESPEDVPVLISHEGDDESHHDVMVNLCLGLPPHFSRFKRVTEIVVQDEAVLAATRKNFGYYSDRGYPVNTHKL